MAKLTPGDKAPHFRLPDIDGSTVSLDNLLKEGHGVAVLWLCNHCPYVIAYMQRIVDLANRFGDIRFVGINSNDPHTYAEDAPDKMPAFVEAHRIPFPYLYDESQEVARTYGVERTPEIFLLNPQGVCVYEGGIDDNWKEPDNVSDQPFREALEALSQGKEIERAKTFATGCTIKWKSAAAS